MNLNLFKQLETAHEARRTKMYKCSAGFNTIGIGHNLDANPISERAVDIIFEDDVKDIVLDPLDKHLPWWRMLDEVRQLVLADMCFNMGWHTLAGFNNTLSALERKDFEATASGMENSLWYKQVGWRGERLVKMMRTGEMPA